MGNGQRKFSNIKTKRKLVQGEKIFPSLREGSEVG
jgi:hypothetical protein